MNARAEVLESALSVVRAALRIEITMRSTARCALKNDTTRRSARSRTGSSGTAPSGAEHASPDNRPERNNKRPLTRSCEATKEMRNQNTLEADESAEAGSFFYA